MPQLIPPVPTGTPIGSYNWADWYEKVRRAINQAGAVTWSNITDFTGSNLNQLQTRLHNDLQGLQGGTGSQYYHLTLAHYNSLTATARRGNATLVAGTLAIANTAVTASTIIMLTRKTIGGTVGNLTYTLNAGVGFTINSSSATDTSVVSYFLIEA